MLEVKDSKNNIEIVHWHYIDERGLEKIKRQADREGGQLLILPSEEEAGALSSRTDDLSSADKDTTVSENEQEKGEKNDKDTLKDDRAVKNITEPEGKRKGMLGVVLDALRKAIGKDNVITDSEEAQRIIDEQNGIVRPERVAEVNKRFNEELQQQIDGTLPKTHTYKLGNPSEILQATGIPNLPIELLASRLNSKSKQENHPFDISEVKDLPNALQNPVAVFSYGDKTKAQNIIVEITHNGKNFLVGISLNPNNLQINDIRGLFPKDTAEWLNWISQGKSLYLDKKRIQTLIDKQRINLAEVEYLDLNSVAKILQNFENPTIIEQKNEKNLKEQRSLYPKDSVQGIIDWINAGNLLKYADKNKALEWIGKQQSNSADVTNTIKNLDVAAKLLQNFENPTINEEKMKKILKSIG